MERLEKCGKINTIEGMELKDVIDVEGKPKVGDTLEMLKKELRRMKVVENREELFSKDTIAYYVQNTEGNRTRKDRWNSKKFVRSDSRPGFFRTLSKNT